MILTNRVSFGLAGFLKKTEADATFAAIARFLCRWRKLWHNIARIYTGLDLMPCSLPRFACFAFHQFTVEVNRDKEEQVLRKFQTLRV